MNSTTKGAIRGAETGSGDGLSASHREECLCDIP